MPVEIGDIGLEERHGIKAKAVVLQQLRAALAIIQSGRAGTPERRRMDH